MLTSPSTGLLQERARGRVAAGFWTAGVAVVLSPVYVHTVVHVYTLLLAAGHTGHWAPLGTGAGAAPGVQGEAAQQRARTPACTRTHAMPTRETQQSHHLPFWLRTLSSSPSACMCVAWQAFRPLPHGAEIHQLRELSKCVPLYMLRLVPQHLQPPCTPSVCTPYTVLTGPPDYLGTNHAPGSPPAIHVRDLRLGVITALGVDFKGRRCLDIGCNDGTVSTQIGESTPASSANRLYLDPADSIQSSI